MALISENILPSIPRITETTQWVYIVEKIFKNRIVSFLHVH